MNNTIGGTMTHAETGRTHELVVREDGTLELGREKPVPCRACIEAQRRAYFEEGRAVANSMSIYPCANPRHNRSIAR